MKYVARILLAAAVAVALCGAAFTASAQGDTAPVPAGLPDMAGIAARFGP